MKRAPVLALMLSLALMASTGANCPLKGSKCTTASTDFSYPYFTDGMDLGWDAGVCSTCGHTSAQISWNTVDDQVGSGVVELRLQASCPSSVYCCQAVSVTAPWSAKTISISDQNAKNLCGENAPIYWTARVFNRSGAGIRDVKGAITCAKSSGGTPTSP